MFKHPVFLTLAAMCCGAPATIVAVVMLPWAIVAAIAGMPTQPMLATFNLLLVIAAPYALGSYWLLAAKTIKGRTFKRGWLFWAACAAALFAIVAVFDALPLGAAAAVAGPIILATAVCLQTQRAISRRNAAQPFAAADGFAAR